VMGVLLFVFFGGGVGVVVLAGGGGGGGGVGMTGNLRMSNTNDEQRCPSYLSALPVCSLNHIQKPLKYTQKIVIYGTKED